MRTLIKETPSFEGPLEVMGPGIGGKPKVRRYKLKVLKTIAINTSFCLTWSSQHIRAHRTTSRLPPFFSTNTKDHATGPTLGVAGQSYFSH